MWFARIGEILHVCLLQREKPGINTDHGIHIMIVVPYYIELHTKQRDVFKIVLLLDNGGRSSIEVPDPQAFLDENGLVLKEPIWQDAGAYLAPIDISKTDITGFYNWTDLTYTDTRECLRSFIKIPGLVLSGGQWYDPYLGAILRHVNKYIQDVPNKDTETIGD